MSFFVVAEGSSASTVDSILPTRNTPRAFQPNEWGPVPAMGSPWQARLGDELVGVLRMWVSDRHGRHSAAGESTYLLRRSA